MNLIEEARIAAMPRRCEPGSDEINYAGVPKALADIASVGAIGIEAWQKATMKSRSKHFEPPFPVGFAVANWSGSAFDKE